MNKVARKVIIWGLIIIIALPNIVVGKPEFKLFGLALAAAMIWWDVVASKKESPKKSVGKK